MFFEFFGYFDNKQNNNTASFTVDHLTAIKEI